MSYLFDLNEKNNTNKNIILSILIFIISLFTILFIYINYNEFIPINITEGEMLYNLKILHLLTAIFSVIAYISCLIQYLCTKNDRYYIVSLMYLNLCIIYTTSLSLDKNVFYFTNSLLRIIFLVCILKSKFIINKKVMSTILLIIFTLILIKIDINFYHTIEVDSSFLHKIHIIISIINIVMSILYSILTYIEYNYTYIFLVGSFVSMSFRNFNFIDADIYLNISANMINSFIGLLFMLISFILTVIGVFFELGNFIKSKTILENELNIFYNLVNLNSFDNIVFKDHNKRIFYANKNTFDNYCNSNYSYEYLNELSSKHNDSDFEIIKKNVLNNNRSLTIYIHKLSSYFKVSIHKYFISPTKYYELIAFTDITKDYLLNLSSRKNEELLKNISDNIQDIIIGITNDGIIEYANKAALDTFGYNQSNIIGENYLSFIADNSTDISLFLETNVKHIYQVRNYYGKIIELESIVKDLSNLEYSSVSKIIIAKDLTERNKLDDITKKYNEVKAYEDSKNEFFANLSHELKTPLNIMYSTVQLFERMQNKDAQVFKSFYFKYKDALRINCLRMLRLVNNLIDITKADVKSIEVNFVNLNIVDFVENITSSINAYAGMKHLDVVFDTNEEEVFIKCDPEKMERILLNLLSNAIKFSPTHKTIDVSVIADDTWVNIYVKDEGIGIDKSMQELIFDRFVQIDKSLNRNTEGSGIGLSIVKSLVELHDGKISLESSVGKGTIFKISIPNISLSYIELRNNNLYSTDPHKIELELSDIYEVF